MQTQGKIQKWGDSSALRLPVEALAAAGIGGNDKVDIQADKGFLIIWRQAGTATPTEKIFLHYEASHGQAEGNEFEKLLAREPGAAKLLAEVKDSLVEAIKLTDETTARCRLLIRKLEQEESSEWA